MLIDLSDPKHVASRGDVPCRYIVEVPPVLHQSMPDYFLSWSGVWLKRLGTGGLFRPGHRDTRFARPATAAEIDQWRAALSTSEQERPQP